MSPGYDSEERPLPLSTGIGREVSRMGGVRLLQYRRRERSVEEKIAHVASNTSPTTRVVAFLRVAKVRWSRVMMLYIVEGSLAFLFLFLDSFALVS